MKCKIKGLKGRMGIYKSWLNYLITVLGQTEYLIFPYSLLLLGLALLGFTTRNQTKALLLVFVLASINHIAS